MNIDINGTTLFYTVRGEGPPMLMLHGNSEDHTVVGPLAERIATRFTVYCPDSPNHGMSARTADFSYETMAEDVTAFVSRLGLRDVSLVGFSDGAIIGMMAQMQSPGLFSRMALLGANLSPADFTPEALTELSALYKKDPDPLLELMLTQPHIEPDDLSVIDVPVLVVGAENDMFTLDSFARIAAALPDSELMIVHGHDHGSYILGNDIMYGPLLEFFTRG